MIAPGNYRWTIPVSCRQLSSCGRLPSAMCIEETKALQQRCSEQIVTQ
ncbi:hypothetical protein SynA1528_01393 [Synechococcus sp. A15-28]|nr:hypothetical protein SynA1528_01393 [Synechococcus sp. A15-28]